MNDWSTADARFDTMAAGGVGFPEAARANGAPVWYLMAKDEGHGFFKKPNRDYEFYATVLFVKQFLLNQ